jgi:hypothetical protein
MAPGYIPLKETSASGTSGNLVASAAGQGIRVYQLLVSNSNTTASTATVSYTLSGTASTLSLFVPGQNQAVLPNSGAPWAAADVGTAITFAAGQSLTFSVYYLQGAGA